MLILNFSHLHNGAYMLHQFIGSLFRNSKLAMIPEPVCIQILVLKYLL